MLSRGFKILALTLFTLTPALDVPAFAEEGVKNNEKLFATTEYHHWYLSEPVSFALRNHTSKTIILTSTSPWCIRDVQGNKIYTPRTSDVIINLQPKEKMYWVWDQRDSHGYQVKAGQYMIDFHDHDVSVSFTIREQLGSRGYSVDRDLALSPAPDSPA